MTLSVLSLSVLSLSSALCPLSSVCPLPVLSQSVVSLSSFFVLCLLSSGCPLSVLSQSEPDMHARLMTTVRDGDVQIHDMWKPGDGSQTLHFFTRNVENVIRELLADIRLAGSRLYELNHWMWWYGRSLPRTMSVADSEKIWHKRMLESRSKGTESKMSQREARDREQTWLKLRCETRCTVQYVWNFHRCQ